MIDLFIPATPWARTISGPHGKTDLSNLGLNLILRSFFVFSFLLAWYPPSAFIFLWKKNMWSLETSSTISSSRLHGRGFEIMIRQAHMQQKDFMTRILHLCISKTSWGFNAWRFFMKPGMKNLMNIMGMVKHHEDCWKSSWRIPIACQASKLHEWGVAKNVIIQLWVRDEETS